MTIVKLKRKEQKHKSTSIHRKQAGAAGWRSALHFEGMLDTLRAPLQLWAKLAQAPPLFQKAIPMATGLSGPG